MMGVALDAMEAAIMEVMGCNDGISSTDAELEKA